MKAKINLVWIFTLFILSLWGQSDHPVLSLPEMNVLYRGYPNKAYFGTNNGRSGFKIFGENLTIKKDSSDFYFSEDSVSKNYTYYLFPDVGRVAKIIFIDSITGDTVGVNHFRISGLPAPQVYFGSINSGSSISLSAAKAMTRLFVKYPPEIPLKAEFMVDTWEISINNLAIKTTAGRGAVLTDEVFNLIGSCVPGDKIYLTVKYKGMGVLGFQSSIISIQ